MTKPISFELLHANLSKFISLESSELKIVDSFFIPIRVPKKTILQKQGEPAGGIYFIVKGCVRSYSVGANDQTHILALATEDWWVSNLHSWVNKEVSRYNIQTVEDSELLYLEYDNFEPLMAAVPKMERYFRIISQRSMAVLQTRILDSLGKDATTRYLEFREKYGHLEVRVPQHMIASFLGITPEFLSMIRNKLTKVKP